MPTETPILDQNEAESLPFAPVTEIFVRFYQTSGLTIPVPESLVAETAKNMGTHGFVYRSPDDATKCTFYPVTSIASIEYTEPVNPYVANREVL